MFDLEMAINNWRRQTEPFCNGDSSDLDELEDHLREEVATLTRAGRTEQDAWAAAVAKLGEPAILSREFAKIDRLSMFDRCAFSAMLGAAAIIVAALFVSLMTRGQRIVNQPVLAFHVTTITLGYLAGLFAAAFAGYNALRAFLAKRTIPALTGVTLRLVRFGSVIAAVFSLFGFAFGATWAYGESGRAFYMDLKELGGMVVIASFLFASIATMRSAVSPRVSLTIAIVAGATVVIAWFGLAAHSAGYPPLFTAFTVLGLAMLFALAVLSLRVQTDAAVP
jgi:hypothetical protein